MMASTKVVETLVTFQTIVLLRTTLTRTIRQYNRMLPPDSNRFLVPLFTRKIRNFGLMIKSRDVVMSVINTEWFHYRETNTLNVSKLSF